MVGNTNGMGNGIKFATLSGTAVQNTFSTTLPIPSGWTDFSKIRVLNVEVERSAGVWRSGQGIVRGDERCFVNLTSGGIALYTDDADIAGKTFRITLAYFM